MGQVRSYEPGVPVWVDLETASASTPADRFYCGLFGWRVVARHRPLDDAAGFWVFQQDGMDIGGLARRGGPVPLSGPGPEPMWIVYIGVSDIEATARVVAANGGALLVRPMVLGDMGRLALFTDPLGARVALWEPDQDRGADIVDVPNSLSWIELSCRHLDQAKDFYGAVFEWEAKSTGFCLPDADRSIAGLVQTDRPARWLIYFAVDDVDVTATRASQLGGTVQVAPFDQPGVGRVAVLTDPEGGTFGVRQPAPARTDPDGSGNRQGGKS